MKPLVCFDMDNTLLKSDKVHVDAFNKAFLKNGLKKVSYKKLASYLDGTQAHVIVKNLFPTLTQKQVKQVTQDHDNFVAKETYIYTKPIKNINNILKEIKKKFTIVIISNCKKKEIKPILKGAGINKNLFKKLIGHDEVKHSKPFPDMLFKAEKLTHHKVACMVGDSTLDIKAGKRAKIKTIAVTTGHHTKTQLAKEKPTTIVKDISKVPKELDKLFKERKPK